MADRPACGGSCKTESDPSEAAIWALARRLHWKMEKMHPEGITWAEMPEEEQYLYYYYVQSILREPKLIRQFYGWPVADENLVCGHGQERE